MADKLRDRLKDLAAFLENEHAVDSVEENLDHLQRAAAECMMRSRALAQEATIYLFQSQDPPSLMEFLDASGKMSEDLRKREISHARIKVLEMLAEFVETYGGHVAVTRKHIVESTRRCQAIARGDWSNKVRSVALDVVINVLKHAESKLKAEDIDPAAYVEKLFYDLKFSKATQTAKGSMLEVMGHLATVFPAQIEPSVPQLLPWIEDALEKQFTTNAPEMLLINGLLEALARMLVFEPERYENGKDGGRRQKLYSYLHRILATTVDGQLSRYQVTKAALQFLAIHATLFVNEIGPNAYTWFGFMKFCTSTDTKTVKENAFAASDAVMQVVGAYLAAENDDQRKRSVNRLLKELLPMLADANAPGSSMAFVLQSLGVLAPAIVLFLGEKGFFKIEDRLRKYGENLLVLDERSTAMRWSTFTSFLQSIVSFAQQPRTSELDGGYIGFMEDIVFHIVNAYPYCLWRSKVTLYKSILSTIRACQMKSTNQLVTSRMTHHLLLLTLSNVAEMQGAVILYHPETGNAETKLLYEFEDLWVAMLRGKKYTNYKSKEITAVKNRVKQSSTTAGSSVEPAERRSLLNSLLHSIFEIIGNLDLSYQYDLHEARAGTSSGGYKPNVPRDHSIMLNLTEFIERLFPRLEAAHLRSWIPLAMTTMFEQSRQFPLVSAFYRIARMFAVLADELKLLTDGEDRQATELKSSELAKLREDYASFISCIVHNLRFYKDELLVATTGCILATPLDLLQVEDYATAIIPTLLLGKSFLPAAEIAVTSLEKWQTHDRARLETIFDRVIPCLALYLEQSDLSATSEDAPVSTVFKQRDLQIREASNGSDWGKLQHRIVVFVGKAGGKAAILLSQDNSTAGGTARRGVSSSSLMLPVKLGDMDVNLSLDNLLLHLGDLASSSTDRRVKAAACEVYHALMCFLAGKTATHPHTSGSKSEYHDMWKLVIPVLLDLATDSEKIGRSLFEPLLYQTTRWFCHSSDTFPHEFSALMDVLVDGLSHETSTAIREVSGKCLSRCLTSVLEKDGAELNLSKAETVFERLFSLCRHPGPAQRTGAATAISYFLRTLREDDIAVVQAFGLRCLKNFLYALKLCGHDARVGKTDVQILEDMITKAILKLQRAVVRYPTAFTRPAKTNSAEDSGFGYDHDLSSFTEWLFSQCASRESAYRASCRQLFLAFTPIVSGSSSKRWIVEFARRAASSGECRSVHEILAPFEQLAVLIHVEDRTNWNLRVTVDWLDQLTASAECYKWCSSVLGSEASAILCPAGSTNLKRKLLEPNQSLSSSGSTPEGQLVISWALHKFLSHFKSLVRLQEANAQLDLDLRRTLRRALLRTAGSVCELWSISYSSSQGGANLEFLSLESTEWQQGLARVIVECFSLASGGFQSDHQAQEHLSKMRQLCSLARQRTDGFMRELTTIAGGYADHVYASVGAISWQLEPDVALHSMQTVNELLGCGAAPALHDTHLAGAFVRAATTSLEQNLVGPRDRATAMEALKIASCLGWNINAMFEDKELGYTLSVIRRELLQFFCNPLVWERVADTLVVPAQPSDQFAPRLGALVNLLSQVLTMKAFAPRSEAIGTFAETYAPRLMKLLRATTHDDDEQTTRLMLEVFGGSLPVFNLCPTRVLSMLRKEIFPEIRKCVLAMLCRRDFSHFAKGDCLAVLANLGPSELTPDNAEIQRALSTFVIDEFPITSSDVKRGSRDYDVFRMLLGKLLVVVEEYRQAEFLQVISFALKEGDRHIFVEDIRASLGRLANAVASRGQDPGASTGEQELDFMVQLTDVLVESSVDQNVRKSLLDFLFIPLVELQNATSLGRFFVAPARQPSSVTVISKLATIVANSGDIASSGAFLTAGVAYSLVEVLFRLVNPDVIRGEINNAFLGHGNGKGREFTMLVCKCASKFVTKSYGDMNDHTRFACWKAYNCLLTAVSRTQKQEKFFDQILFQESLWINIVDVALEYELHTETKPFDRVPLSSFSATTLRQQQEQQRGGKCATQNTDRRGSSRESAASLRFFTGSSLSQLSLDTGLSQHLLGSGDLAAQEAIYEGVEIELDAINEHPCMIPLLRVLKQMKADFGEGWGATSMPPWMAKIFDVVANPTTELNIRLFIVKVVLNVPDVFQRYSSMWADKMLDALLEATVSSSSGKQAEFHYLLRDCCSLLIDDWNDVDVSSMRITASRFVNELIELAPNADSNFIMQDNLLLITQLILQWTSQVRIDVSIVSKLLRSQNENPRQEAANRYSALQVISAMLSVGLFDELASEFLHSMDGGDNLQDGIVQAMEHKRPSIYNVAAEVSGLLLAAQDKTLLTTSATEAFRSKLLERITSFYNDEDFGRFLSLLRSVSLHDPAVLDSTMLHRLSFVLPKVVGIENWSLRAVECLENAAKNSTVAAELFTHCFPVLPRFLSHRNSAVQLHAARLVESLVAHVDDAAISRLVDSEQNAGLDLFHYPIGQEDPAIRRVFISIAVELHTKSVDGATKEAVRQHILRGLADYDTEIRKQVLDFLKASGLLQTTCRGRFVELFDSLFAPSVADVWVLYATNLLLDMSAGSHEFEDLLFKSPLGQGEYHEASIDSAWESKDQTMTPMFSVETDLFSASTMLARRHDSVASHVSSLDSSSQMDASLAAQSQLIASSLASQDWASPSSSSFSQGFFGGSQNDGASGKQRRRRRFMKRSKVTSNSNTSDKSDKNHFQEQYALFKKNEEAMLTRQRKARAQQVVMRRKYRAGDYPDIQIKLRDVLSPLMVLCEMHAKTSTIVFAGLMPAIVTATDRHDGEEASKKLGSFMERALEEGKRSLVFVGAVHSAYFTSFIKDASVVQSIGLSYKTIGATSLASGANSLGELILEEYLNLNVPGSRDETAECWDHLYNILAATQKSNLLVALASECCTVEDSKLALQAQLAGDLPGAIASYRKAETALESELDMQPEDALLGARFELHRSTWERFACLEKLNHWDKLQREYTSTTTSDGFDFVWQEPSPYVEQGIGHCLRSLLGSIDTSSMGSFDEYDTAHRLKVFFSEAQRDPSRWDLVTSRFGVEASLALIALGEIGQARILTEQLYSRLLTRWSASSKIAKLTRLELLQNLSSVVEIDEALRLVSAIEASKSKHTETSGLVSFGANWGQISPSLGEGSMSTWSQFFLVQKILRGFMEKVGEQEGVMTSEMLNMIHQDESKLMLRYAGAAVHNDILALASKYLKDYRELCNTQNLPKVSVLMVDVFVSHVLKLAQRQAQKTSIHGERLAPDAVNAITKYYETSTKMFDNSDILELMEQLPVEDRVAMGTLEAKTFGTAAQFYINAGLDKALTEEFFTRAFDTFRRSSRAIPIQSNDLIESEPAGNREGSHHLPASYTRCRTTFIEFLVDVLFSANNSEWTAFVDRKTLVGALMENVLGGMASGDQECSNYFPQLCELVPAFPVLVTDFEVRILTQVPIWTCLRWSSQLLALVNGPIGSTIVRILEKMAAEYPAALFYDFKLTFGDLNSSTTSPKPDLGRLTLLVSNPVMQKFVDALRLIHHPELRLKEGLRELAKLVDEGKLAAAKAQVAHIWEDCFATEHKRLGGSIGHYNRDWARRAKRDVEKIMGRDGANLTAKSVLAAREWISNNFNVTPGKHGITKDMKARLTDFAEWLDEFDHSRCRLELPGQYTTRWGKPDPTSHVHILSIHSTLGVLVSKQLPKQITLHCSDQNNYTFLVKGGEDLRLDQRIEQLFDVMNQILASDARCRDRTLCTKTYKVIPMTTEIGMIEWLHGTSTLKGIIERQLQQDARCQQLQSNKRATLQLFNTVPAKQYESFLMKQRGSSFAAKVAGPSRDDVVSSFRAVQELIPGDLLRRQLLSLGTDFEDFISIRDEFASSLAVFNACSYILGIGDRHLDNFLLDHSTGRVIGIDFGVSFGAGASVLPVPELVPFRFTRQMDSVLRPYDSSNLLIQDMQAVFEAFRAKKQVIESVMNVFLHEPLLDWQQSTTTHQAEIFRDASISDEVTQQDDDFVMVDVSSSDTSNSEPPSKKRATKAASLGSSTSSSSGSSAAPSTAWLPDVKITIARRKLDGLSPRMLLKEELAQNPHLGKQLKHFQAIVDLAVGSGAPQSATPMSSLAQAQELVALATAPDILGRTYHGWMPWL